MQIIKDFSAILAEIILSIQGEIINFVKQSKLNANMKKTASSILLLLCIFISAKSQIFYKVSGNGLEKPSYLFGTHHLAPLNVFTDDKSATEAFASSSQIVGEIDMTINQMEMAMKMQPYMMAPTDSTLSKVIPTDKFTEADSLLQNILKMPGITLKAFDMLKPMAVTQQITIAVMMQNMPDFKANEQLDSHFQKSGMASGKKIVALETIEQQADLFFCARSIRSQANDLLEILYNPQEIISEAKKLNEAYFSKDLDALYQLAKNEDSDPWIFEKLLIERNENWIKLLPEIMKSESSFIAVGCLHLAGEHGLVTQLRNLGYTVEAQ